MEALPTLEHDGLETPTVGEWSGRKYQLVRTYAYLFARGTRKKWKYVCSLTCSREPVGRDSSAASSHHPRFPPLAGGGASGKSGGTSSEKALSMSAVLKTWSVVSENEHSYSCWYHHSPRSRTFLRPAPA